MAMRVESQAEPIPGYRLIERLGGGGFGEVWKAEAPGGLLKAIKFVYGDLQTSGEEGQRAEQELKALSRVKTVRHPYILSLERYDIVGGQLMIVMELADRNLWDRFRECRSEGLPGIPREELLRYMEETAEALDLMNIQYQLQHLDIKPQNVFLVHSHVKVADFGLVKDLEGMAASVTGGVTPVYAAPETFDGWISRYCDQYSLAIVFQELLTGQRPFVGSNVRQLILQHLQGTPNLDPLPPEDRPAVARALSKSPDSRFPSCQAFVNALRNGAAPVQVVIGPTSPAVRSPEPARAASPVPSGRADGRPEVKDPVRPTSAPPAPAPVAPAHPRVAEVEGEGVLVPSLVLGLGQLGLGVLQRLRESLDEGLGQATVLPNLRVLYIDTDPEAPRAGTTPQYGKPLSTEEILQVRLNRPSHYLRSREGRSQLEAWFNSKMLYRIPRHLVTTGMRALGRLALYDNFRSVGHRLRSELDLVTRPENLSQAAHNTRLGFRTNRPRVYVVTSLAGGTGSGMFLDVAYVVRAFLREAGYDTPDLIGVFFLPAVDRNPARTLALGNTFAALTELHHFSLHGTTFNARYDDRQARLQESQPPFTRCLVLTLPEAPDEGPLRDRTGLVADLLYRELVTPLGRSIDACRARRLSRLGPPTYPAGQTIGVYRMSWPRRQLLQRVARHLCRQLVQRWMAKDSSPIRASVQAWAAEQWAQQELSAESLIGRLQAACEAGLGQPADATFQAMTAPLTQLGSQAPEDQLLAVREVLKQVEDLVGRPEGTTGSRSTRMKEVLEGAGQELATAWGQRMAELAVGLIEQPEFRLAGAEEAIRQFVHSIEQVLHHYEPLVKELTTRVNDAHGRIFTLLGNVQEIAAGGRRAATLVSNLIELVRLYPKWRYQSLVLQQVTAVYISLRGYLSDQLRDINFCRARLGEMQRSFDTPPPGGVTESSFRRDFFPAGCRNLDEAVAQFLARLTPADVQELDAQVQEQITQQFTALRYVCLTSSNLLRNLEHAMQGVAETFVSTLVGSTNVAEMFLAHYEEPTAAVRAIQEAYQAAAPETPNQSPSAPEEVCVLAVPAGESGQRFAELAREALHGVDFDLSQSPDDIVFYRELPRVALADLEQVGPLASEAYNQMTTLEHFTPHSRIDITEWKLPER